MPERVWRKGNLFTLLVGMYIDTAILFTMENSMKILLKTRNKTTIWPSNPTTGQYPEDTIIQMTHGPQGSKQQYLQKQGHGSNLDVHQQMNGRRYLNF